jgi:hypothetical protein
MALTLGMGAGMGSMGMGGGRRTHGGGTNQSQDAIDFEPLKLEGEELTEWQRQLRREQRRGRLTNSQKRAIRRGDVYVIQMLKARHGDEFDELFADLLGGEA